MLKESALPFALVINPIAYAENQLPVINYGENEIPRCESNACRAYLNPFVKWLDGGQKWICNICKFINVTKDYYYEKLNNYGTRVDALEKTELAYGSYEFIANKTYIKMDKPLAQPTYIFVIDVSLAAIQNNFLNSVIESIKDIFNSDALPYQERTRVAFITYDSAIHFYSLKHNQPIMLCVSDETMFLPCPIDNLLVNANDNKKNILTLLDMIQNSYTNNTCKDSNKIFHGISAAYLLAKKSGAKVVVFNSSQSMTLLPKMKSKNVPNLPKEELIYSPTDDKQLSSMGINLTNENISIDVFATAESYIVNPILIV
jgi:protein transport protein SEC24